MQVVPKHLSSYIKLNGHSQTINDINVFQGFFFVKACTHVANNVDREVLMNHSTYIIFCHTYQNLPKIINYIGGRKNQL